MQHDHMLYDDFIVSINLNLDHALVYNEQSQRLNSQDLRLKRHHWAVHWAVHSATGKADFLCVGALPPAFMRVGVKCPPARFCNPERSGACPEPAIKWGVGLEKSCFKKTSAHREELNNAQLCRQVIPGEQLERSLSILGEHRNMINMLINGPLLAPLNCAVISRHQRTTHKRQSPCPKDSSNHNQS